jgi:hypothetical protein
MSLSLGALIPGDVYTYQFLCALPLAVVLVLRGVQNQNWISLGLVAVCLWVFISNPCALVFPSLWTIALMGLFAVGLVTAKQHRPEC